MAVEEPSRIEPAFIEDTIPTELANLSIEIKEASANLGHGLPVDSVRELRMFVAIMNSCYSNLLE